VPPKLPRTFGGIGDVLWFVIGALPLAYNKVNGARLRFRAVLHLKELDSIKVFYP
jgi:hypothetical protein